MSSRSTHGTGVPPELGSAPQSVRLLYTVTFMLITLITQLINF
jgi:hypothetical protein